LTLKIVSFKLFTQESKFLSFHLTQIERTRVMKNKDRTTIIGILCLLMLSGGPVLADIEGSADHPGVKRYEGSEIIKYEVRAYDEFTIALGKARSSSDIEEAVTVEGKITRLTYKIPPARSPLEVIRNYERDLQSAGATVLFAGGGKELGSYFAEAAGYKEIQWPPNVPALTLNSDSQRYLAMEKKSEEASLYLILYAVENRFWASNLKGVEKGQVLLQVDVVESEAMEQRMVTVTAAEMASAIAASGSIALYGIYFDTDKADLKLESAATIAEIATLLNDNRDLKLLVVGHTDNIGSFTYNRELSKKRAAAVVNQLTSNHGIRADRLQPVGVSYACPVASNKTEEGRALNRRVELVED
jgi:outer membrane protein OmpA-like peptidoglycan-associated protein